MSLVGLLITNRKSHTGFRLVPKFVTWMILNGVIALILRYFTEFDCLADRLRIYVAVVEDRPRPILSAEYFWPKLTHPAARSLCDSWATCFITFLVGIAQYRPCFKTHSCIFSFWLTGSCAAMCSLSARRLRRRNGVPPPETVFEWKKRTETLEGVRGGAVGAEDPRSSAPKARWVSMQLGNLGERCKLPQRIRRSPAAKRHLVHFWFSRSCAQVEPLDRFSRFMAQTTRFPPKYGPFEG